MASDPAERLGRLAGEVARLGDDGTWLARGLLAYLAPGASITMDAALGLRPRPGQETWRTRARRAERDALIRELGQLYPAAGRAQAVATELAQYEARCWPRERQHGPREAGSDRATLYKIFAVGERVPTSRRHLAVILAVAAS